MAPPWDPLALIGALPGLVKGWLAGPVTAFSKLASQQRHEGENRSTADAAADSSDLLRRRMAALNLDPADVDRLAAPLMGIKTGLCARCEARGQCLRDLGDEFGDPGWGDWRNYCPNATTLTMMSTLRSCVEEEQADDQVKSAAQ